eukprot:gene1251-biopygen480
MEKWVASLSMVKEFIVSEDKQVRGAVISLVNTKGTFTRLRRSVQHLYPIEVTANDERGKKLSKFDDIEETEGPRVRPRGVAAMNADLIRKIVDKSID